MRHLRTIVHACAGTLLLVGAGTGCTNNLGDFTLVASKNIDLEHFDTSKGEASAPVTGEDSKFFGVPSLKEAVDKAEESGNAKSLTNVRLSEFYIPIIPVYVKFTATGNAVAGTK